MHTSWLSVSLCLHSLNPQTCTWIRLLGPCFKTGQIIHHIGVIAKDTRNHNGAGHCKTAKHNAEYTHGHSNQCCYIMIMPWAIQVGSQHAEQGALYTGNKFQCSNKWANWLSTAHCNPARQQTYYLLCFQQFQILLTLFSKSFSHFPQGTCLLSFPTQHFCFRRSLPPSLHSTAEERDSWEHTLHERSHMTQKSVTFIATSFQKHCMHTSISNAM